MADRRVGPVVVRAVPEGHEVVVRGGPPRCVRRERDRSADARDRRGGRQRDREAAAADDHGDRVGNAGVAAPVRDPGGGWIDPVDRIDVGRRSVRRERGVAVPEGDPFERIAPRAAARMDREHRGERRGAVERPPGEGDLERGAVDRAPGERREEPVDPGGADPRDRIPPPPRRVPVRSRLDVVEDGRVVAAAEDRVERRVEESERAPRVLIGERREPRPDRGREARPPDAGRAAPDVDLDGGRRVGRDVGDAPGRGAGRDAGTVLPPRAGERGKPPARTALILAARRGGPRGVPAPGDLAAVGARGRDREFGPADPRDVRIGGGEVRGAPAGAVRRSAVAAGGDDRDPLESRGGEDRVEDLVGAVGRRVAGGGASARVGIVDPDVVLAPAQRDDVGAVRRDQPIDRFVEPGVRVGAERHRDRRPRRRSVGPLDIERLFEAPSGRGPVQRLVRPDRIVVRHRGVGKAERRVERGEVGGELALGLAAVVDVHDPDPLASSGGAVGDQAARVVGALDLARGEPGRTGRAARERARDRGGRRKRSGERLGYGSVPKPDRPAPGDPRREHRRGRVPDVRAAAREGVDGERGAEGARDVVRRTPDLDEGRPAQRGRGQPEPIEVVHGPGDFRGGRPEPGGDGGRGEIPVVEGRAGGVFRGDEGRGVRRVRSGEAHEDVHRKIRRRRWKDAPAPGGSVRRRHLGPAEGSERGIR